MVCFLGFFVFFFCEFIEFWLNFGMPWPLQKLEKIEKIEFSEHSDLTEGSGRVWEGFWVFLSRFVFDGIWNFGVKRNVATMGATLGKCCAIAVVSLLQAPERQSASAGPRSVKIFTNNKCYLNKYKFYEC